jgi:penicillin amidase
MRILFRGLTTLIATAGVLLLLLAVLIGAALWFTVPRGHQHARIAGLSAPVEISFDQDGIPRIRAATERDAVAALGYVHARDRMFQMELMRRAAAGRVAEIAGPKAVGFDRTMRVLGAHHSAERDLASLPADTRDLLEAYATGVNARIRARGRFIAPEFLVLGPPEPWRTVDSLLWGKTMGLWLSMNWRTELSRLALTGRVPDSVIDQLWPSQADPGRADTMRAADPRHAEAAARLLDALPWFPGPHTMPPSASNEWAVDGRHTVSGAPLLAGDPHLRLAFPGIWYLARIDLPDRSLVGATGPGVPGIVIGHNGQIAWTFTTTGADVQDVFIETPVGTDFYQTPDGPAPFTRREERILVRGKPDEVLTVRETRHGPVISDVQPAANGAILAVAMGHLQPGDTPAAGLVALNRARDLAEARAAAALITSPAQNLLVADRVGIALFMTGRVPIRKAGDGSRPVPGDGSHDWIGWAGPDRLPAITAPASGRLVNANERVAPPDYPVFLGHDWFGDWRARRIREMLDAGGPFAAADFARMQVDAVSVFARAMLPVLLSVPLPEGPATLRSMLSGWDGTMAIDRPEPLIFNAWIAEIHRHALRAVGVPHEHGGPVIEFVAHVLRDAGAERDALLRDALIDAERTLRERHGADATTWRWGDAHVALFEHPILRNIPVLGRLTTASIASPGDDSTVNRGGMDAMMRHVHGAGFRAVFDLGDLEASLFMATPGQSGNPLSRDARHFLTRWRDGETLTIPREPTSVRATLRITPPAQD